MLGKRLVSSSCAIRRRFSSSVVTNQKQQQILRRVSANFPFNAAFPERKPHPNHHLKELLSHPFHTNAPLASSEQVVMNEGTEEVEPMPKKQTKKNNREHVINGFKWAKQLAIHAGVNEGQWSLAVVQFGRDILQKTGNYFANQEELELFLDEVQSRMLERSDYVFLFYPLFLKFCEDNGFLPNKDQASLLELTDLRFPHQWYPEAVQMKRKIIYHVGPTNSGKTYQALQCLKDAGEDGGVYCGPLRLLALEIYERLNTEGVYCSLVTGQERREIPLSTHVACTMEMTKINRKYDVAVIDEIQMIGDPYRGWAWTRALSGLQANEIHVCGSMEGIDLVKNFAEVMNDDFELQEYERRSPLSVQTASLVSYKHVKRGDCVVAFSRRNIFAIKQQIEKEAKLKCCIIYGQLPPETRSQQARLFNDPNNDYDVLVASDAVGMGLNLNIHRIIFDSVKKFDGSKDLVDIPPSLVKQIAGRAGRSGSDYAHGKVTTLRSEDLSYVEHVMNEVPVPHTSAGLFPSSQQMEEFATQMSGITDLSELLDKYVMISRLDGNYFMCNHMDMKFAASHLQQFDFESISERFTFCMAPVNMRNFLARKIFLLYAKCHTQKVIVPLEIYLPRIAPITEEQLRNIEIKAQIIDLYIWLSYRFEETFIHRDEAEAKKAEVLKLVEQGLVNTAYNSKASQEKKRKDERNRKLLSNSEKYKLRMQKKASKEKEELELQFLDEEYGVKNKTKVKQHLTKDVQTEEENKFTSWTDIIKRALQ